MRLGGPLFDHAPTPEAWIAKAQQLGYRAAYSPVHPGSTTEEKQCYLQAAKAARIVIAEFGTWSRTFLRGLAGLSPDMPILLEHLQKPEEYAAAAHIRSVAAGLGIPLDAARTGP